MPRDSINRKSKGVLPISVLSTDEFDVADIDVGSLLFGDPPLIEENGATPVSPIRRALEVIEAKAAGLASEENG